MIHQVPYLRYKKKPLLVTPFNLLALPLELPNIRYLIDIPELRETVRQIMMLLINLIRPFHKELSYIRLIHHSTISLSKLQILLLLLLTDIAMLTIKYSFVFCLWPFSSTYYGAFAPPSSLELPALSSGAPIHAVIVAAARSQVWRSQQHVA